MDFGVRLGATNVLAHRIDSVVVLTDGRRGEVVPTCASLMHLQLFCGRFELCLARLAEFGHVLNGDLLLSAILRELLVLFTLALQGGAGLIQLAVQLLNLIRRTRGLRRDDEQWLEAFHVRTWHGCNLTIQRLGFFKVWCKLFTFALGN